MPYLPLLRARMGRINSLASSCDSSSGSRLSRSEDAEADASAVAGIDGVVGWEIEVEAVMPSISRSPCKELVDANGDASAGQIRTT